MKPTPVAFVVLLFISANAQTTISTTGNVCDSGTFLIQSNQLVPCQPNSATCPSPYICGLFGATNGYYCCVGNFNTNLICPAGSSAYRSTVTGNPQACIPNTIGNVCPMGFTCLYSSTLMNNFCCSQYQYGFCPSGTNPYIDPIALIPRNCQPGVMFNCPAYYTCQFSTAASSYMCCPFIQDPMCPYGTADRGFCTPNRPDNCPFGYDCVYSLTSYKFVCCPRVSK